MESTPELHLDGGQSEQREMLGRRLSNEIDAAKLRRRRSQQLQHRNSWPTNIGLIPPSGGGSQKGGENTGRGKVQLPETKEEEERLEDEVAEEEEEHLTMATALFNSEEDFPSAQQQRRYAETEEKKTDHSYPVSEVWYRRWQEYVGIARGHVPGQTLPPGPLEMDLSNAASNTWIDEEVWKRLVRWYGVAATHPLDRKCRSSRDNEATFEVCLLSPFSGIVEHRIARLSRSEAIGYVECQLRWTFEVPEHRRSRLWISEKTVRPQFRQLLKRTRTLGESVESGMMENNILALETTTDDREGGWPTGETGEPEGELYIYATLHRRPGSSSKWKEFVSGSLESYSRRVVESVNRATEDLVRSGTDFVKHHSQLLTEDLHRAETRLAELNQRERTLVAREAELSNEEEDLNSMQIQQESTKLELEAEEQGLNSTNPKRRASQRGADHKVRLNVGGNTFTTSVGTLVQDADSMLAVMFSGRYELNRGSDGNYFIDRDGTHFPLILNFLRDGAIDVEALPKDMVAVQELLTEARFYGVQKFIELLEDVVKQRIHENSAVRQH